MLTPTHLRKDKSIPVITIGLDNKETTILKKFKCSICGGTVFGYYDTVTFLLPVDTASHNEATNKAEDYMHSAGRVLDEIECTHRYKDASGRLVRCRAIYLLMR